MIWLSSLPPYTNYTNHFAFCKVFLFLGLDTGYSFTVLWKCPYLLIWVSTLPDLSYSFFWRTKGSFPNVILASFRLDILLLLTVEHLRVWVIWYLLDRYINSRAIFIFCSKLHWIDRPEKFISLPQFLTMKICTTKFFKKYALRIVTYDSIIFLRLIIHMPIVYYCLDITCRSFQFSILCKRCIPQRKWKVEKSAFLFYYLMYILHSNILYLREKREIIYYMTDVTLSTFLILILVVVFMMSLNGLSDYAQILGIKAKNAFLKTRISKLLSGKFIRI